MLYTIIDIYEVMRTDEIYPEFSYGTQNCNKNDDNAILCTDPYRFL